MTAARNSSPRHGIGGLPQDRIPPILDPGQVAAWLQLGSGRQALELARQRRLPFVKIGKRVLFRRDGILKALERAEVRELSDGELDGRE